ncbi:MAG: long-chain fatty acid--CoA ligase [Halioglobus sp.]|nr:long-chain fatty acid--CoA ligase [Halioglobus sp.]
MATIEELTRAALRREPDRPALEFNGAWINWGELSRIAATVRSAIQTNSGKVALVTRNRPSGLAALLGLLADGHAIRMVYPFQSAAALAADLERIGPASVVADREDLAPEVLQALDNLDATIVALDGAEASLLRSGVVTDSARFHAAPGIEILTSGTTGPPKPFALSYQQVIDHILGESVYPAKQVGDPAELPPTLLMFPVGNISGLYSTLPPLITGQRAVLLEKFTVAGWHDYVVRFRPVMSGMPPAGLQMVLDADIPPQDLSSLQVMGTGAAPLDPSVKRAFEDRYGLPVLLSYGATEFAGPVTRMTPELLQQWGEEKFTSVGRALPGVQLRVLDPDTKEELPAGQEGLLEVVSPRIGPHWIRTSDLAAIDADGFLYHRGRADGAIMRGGFKLMPGIIEQALQTHPAVAQACVVGIADHRLGEVPVAAIEIAAGQTAPATKALEDHLRGQLPSTHVPSDWRLLPALPRTPSMKVDLPAVRRLFEKPAE